MLYFYILDFNLNDILYIYHRIKALSQNGTNTSPSSNKKPDPESLTVDESKKNPCFPAAHSVVKFHYQSHRGRYAVADEDIEVCNVNCYFNFLYLFRDGSINIMLYDHFESGWNYIASRISNYIRSSSWKIRNKLPTLFRIDSRRHSMSKMCLGVFLLY